MILIPIACFILGGDVVYLYFAYKEREPKTDIKPPVVYLPPDIEVVKQQVENIYKTELDYYKADIIEAKDIIKNLISSNDINSYQKAEASAKEWLSYEKRGDNMIEKCKGCRHDNEYGIVCCFCVGGDNYQPEDTKDYDYPETEGEEND